MTRVRVNGVYIFKRAGWDVFDGQHIQIADGVRVRVITLPGCPPANTMGHCYVETMQGEFVGLVSTASLTR